MHPRLPGGWLAKSLQAYGLMYLFFASVSAVYMNHYSHPRDFYVYNILDGIIAFGVVGLANAFLYPRVVGRGEVGAGIVRPAWQAIPPGIVWCAAG